MIMQKSMDTSVVPTDWKIANITPIYKKGSKAEAGNYRPVSLTSICCKIMESVIRDDLVEHLTSNNNNTESDLDLNAPIMEFSSFSIPLPGPYNSFELTVFFRPISN